MIPWRVREIRIFQRVEAFVKKHERLFMPSMLLLGTAIDAVQFRLLSVRTTFIVVGMYAVLCALAMIVMVSYPAEQQRWVKWCKVIAPFIQQFTIGALLSTSLLFYWFSGTLSASWPIVGGVALLMVSNEALRMHFTKPLVQVGVYYFALFSLCATLFAFVFNSLSPAVFIFGGLASLLFVAFFLVVLLRVGRLFAYRTHAWVTVTIIFALMTSAYVLNVIPPIPLSLRDAGMYYGVTRSGGEYVLTGPEELWLERLIPGQKFVLADARTLYAYTAIWAPVAMSTTMVHRWEWYDEVTNDWMTMSQLHFGITGGRSDGYRGYSLKSNLKEGKWRVSVETTRGQVVGRIRFRITSGDE